MVNGRSLISRAAKIALDSLFKPVYIYSDSDEISSVAASHGAIAIPRPEQVSGDSATSEETIQQFLEQVDPKNNLNALALYQCTTPFLRTSDLDKVHRLFSSGGYDSVVTAAKFERFLGYRADKIPGVQDPSAFVPFNPYRQRRQEMCRPFHMENGGIYLATCGLWKVGRRIGTACGVVEMDWWRSMEIDCMDDLEVANAIAPLLEGPEFHRDAFSMTVPTPERLKGTK